MMKNAPNREQIAHDLVVLWRKILSDAHASYPPGVGTWNEIFTHITARGFEKRASFAWKHNAEHPLWHGSVENTVGGYTVTAIVVPPEYQCDEWHVILDLDTLRTIH